MVESGDTVISENDSEMDMRARCAVKSAIEKAYLEFANGERKYV